ncbi:monocarboxylate transporter 12-like [Penaeus chinensis]|uniref:monocarboxylate transporter 12-like n=1 Tax=Penaeus chinensis TaxID=139456 RepID=UPI001FB77633|nr:monocarboxylate transporter 12-like [Penaeus chinensis]
MGLSKVTFKDEHKNGGIVNVSYKPDEYEVTKPETEVSENNGGREQRSGGVIDEEIKIEHRHVREEEKEKEEKEESEEELPDGGWGWVITFGCITIAIAINFAGPCFGILFSGFLLDLGTSSTNVAWIFNLRSFIVNIAALFLDPLVAEWGWRKVGFVSSLLLSLGFAVSSFANSALYLLCSYSILTGIGSGWMMGTIFSMIPYYFKRRLGIANALMHGGICVGQMAGPPMITYLQEQYGFSGSTLIMAAILLNGCVGAAVLHPVEWHMKTRNKENAWERKTKKKIEMDPDAKTRPCATVSRVFTTIFTNLELLRSPRVLIITVASALNMTSYLNFLMFAPFALQTSGLSLEETSWCMSVSGFCMLVARLVVSSLTDLPRLSKRGCYMAGTATVFVTTIAFTFVRGLTWSSVVIGVWAAGVGAFMSLHNLIMVEYVGLDKLVPTLGICGIFSGLSSVIIGPVIGVIRDVSQSYAVSMWALSGCFAVALLLWLLMPAAVAYDQRREGKRMDSPS